MNIEHEIVGVSVIRCRTIAHALALTQGKHHLHDLSAFILGTMRLDRRSERDLALLNILHEPLWRDYEGAEEYEKTLALVSLEKEMLVPDFRKALGELGYYPASMSESASFLMALMHRGTKAYPVFHLGTAIRDEKFQEYRLLVREGGVTEFIPFYPAATKLKAYYLIVAVKKEGRN